MSTVTAALSGETYTNDSCNHEAVHTVVCLLDFNVTSLQGRTAEGGAHLKLPFTVQVR